MGYTAGDIEDREEDVNVRDHGALTLLRRSVKLFWAHGRLFLSILVLILFPLDLLQDALVETLTSVENRGVIGPAARKWANGSFEVEPGVIVSTAALFLAIFLIASVVTIVPSICVIYGVAGIVSNRAVALADALSAARKLWRPATATSLCFFAISSGVVVVASPLMYAAYLLQSVALTVAASVLMFVLLVLTAVVIGFVFQLALILTVLEGVQGWKALGKSWKLLQGKKWVAFKMQIVTYLLVTFVEFLSVYITKSIYGVLGIAEDPLGKVDSRVVIVMAIKVVLHATFASGYLMFMTGAETLLYFSCKALHQESVAESDFFQNQVMQGAYMKASQQSQYPDV